MIQTTLFSLLTLALAAQTPAPEATKEAPKPAATAIAAPEAKKETAKAPAPAKKDAAAKTEPKKDAKAEPKKDVKAEPKKEEKKDDKILAKIGHRVVRQSDMDFALEGMAPQERAKLEQTPGGRERYTKTYIELFILAAKARKDGIDKAPHFDQKLMLATDQLLANELMRKDAPELQKKLTPTEEDLKAFFDKNVDKFKGPEKFSARHILVSTKGGAAGEKGLSDEDAKAKVAKIQEEFKKGRSWDELAKEFSEDPGSKDKGGLYENIAFGSFVGEFEAAVRKQEPGKVGEPVKTNFGYHLIQVEKVMPSETPTYDKVKDQIKQRAMAERQEQVWNEYLNAIKKEVSVQMGDDLKAGGAAAPAATPAAKNPKAATKKTTEAKKTTETKKTTEAPK